MKLGRSQKSEEYISFVRSIEIFLIIVFPGQLVWNERIKPAITRLRLYLTYSQGSNRIFMIELENDWKMWIILGVVLSYSKDLYG